MSLFQSQTPIPGPQPLPSSVASILSRLPHPTLPAATLPPSQSSTGAQLFQRIQQLQAQQAITLNPAYQPPPPAPSGLIASPASAGFFGGFGNPTNSNVQHTFQSHGFFQPPATDPWSASRKIEPPKGQPDYYPESPSVDPSRTLGSFESFLRLPIEIIGLVVEQCVVQDGVCLSLASKHMYALARPILLRKDKEAYSLTRMSRYGCAHFLSREGGHKPCPLRSCRNTATFPGRHCSACVSCPLSVRLGNNNWSGLPSKQFAYCSHRAMRWEWASNGEVPPGADNVVAGNGRTRVWISICRKFKLRKKFHKGKCLHGHPRPKKRKEGQGSLTWTYMKVRGGWQARGQMWKSLYTETDLHNFQDRYREERESSERYNLRRKPRPTAKRVEHVNLRYGVDLENPSGRGPVEGTMGWDEEV